MLRSGRADQRTDAAGNVTSNSLFDPFGRLIWRQGAYDRFGFTGGWSGATGR